MAIQKRLLKQPNEAKLYENKLKNEVRDLIYSFKKRYKDFPDKAVVKMFKYHFEENDSITIADTKYTIKEAEVEFQKTYKKLKSKLSSSYFNFIIKAYNSDVKKSPNDAKKIYEVYHSEIQSESKQIWTDFRFCLSVMKEMTKKIKNMTNNDKPVKNVTESEDTFMDTMIRLNNGEEFSLSDIIIAAYESFDDDEFDELVEEGVTSDTLKVAKDATKAVKDLTKKIRKDVKANRFKEAYKNFDELDKILDNCTKGMNDIEVGDNIDFVLSSFTTLAIILIKSFILLLPATAFGAGAVASAKAGSIKLAMVLGKGAAVASIPSEIIICITEGLNSFNALIDVINKIKNKKELTADDFNPLKVRTIKYIKDLKALVKRYRKHIEKVEKRSDPKAVKEAAEYEANRLSIYERCQNGDITVEQREELLETLNNQRLVSETVDNVSDNQPDISGKELYENVRLALYEKCAAGEITESEREEMLLEAFKQVFMESEDGLDMKDVEKDIENDKNVKDMEKQLKEAENDDK